MRYFLLQKISKGILSKVKFCKGVFIELQLVMQNEPCGFTGKMQIFKSSQIDLTTVGLQILSS